MWVLGMPIEIFTFIPIMVAAYILAILFGLKLYKRYVPLVVEREEERGLA